MKMENNNVSKLIELIDEKLTIDQIIGKYINIEKKGNNFVAICPFHSDTNPSMSISPSKKIFKCFSCGASGNMISFVQNHQGINFIDALKVISEFAQIDWKEFLKTPRQKYINPEVEKIWQINKEAKSFFSYFLKSQLSDENSNITKYVKQRNLNNEDIAKFEIGFTSKKNELLNFLKKKNFSNEDLIKSGIMKLDENGNISDYFIERIMFPINDEFGNTIGFSGRIIIENDKYSKYMNSSETIVFKKGNFLYNLDKAKKEIMLKGFAILVEGFMDVVAFSKIGINNVVATMGTAFTKNHIDLLNQITKNIILSFDNDKAGFEVAIKSGQTLIENGFEVKKFEFENAKDIDEFISNKNRSTIDLDYIKSNSKDFKNFLIDNFIKNNSEKPVFSELKKILTIFKNSISKIELDFYIGKISKALNITKHLIYLEIGIKDNSLSIPINFQDSGLDELQNMINNSKPMNKNDKEKSNNRIEWGLKQIEREETKLLGIAIVNNEVLKYFLNTNYHFHSSIVKKVYSRIASEFMDHGSYNDIEFDESTESSKVMEKILKEKNIFNSMNKQNNEIKIKIDEMIKKINDNSHSLNNSKLYNDVKHSKDYKFKETFLSQSSKKNIIK